MPLSVSMEIAKSSLDTLQERTAVVSRNIGNAGNDYASRKIVHTVSAPGGGVRIGSIERATDSALFKNVLVANAKVGEQQEIDRALDRLNETISDPEQDFSPAALVGKLGDALQQYSAGPQDPIRAKAVLDAATDMVNGLESATEATQNVRATADAEIGRTVERLNAMFANVEKVNLEIVRRSDCHKFVVLPKRWIVERTIGWLNRCRRMAKDWECLNRSALAFLRWASVRLMLRRLCRTTT